MCTTEISSVSNIIKKFKIQSDLHSVYQKNFYHDEQDIMDELFHQYHISLLKDIDHPELITEWETILILLIMKNI